LRFLRGHSGRAHAAAHLTARLDGVLSHLRAFTKRAAAVANRVDVVVAAAVILGDESGVVGRGTHAASSAVTCDATISAYVGQVSSNCLCVPSPTVCPSSSTRIWSAWMIVDTRCATITFAASRVYGASAARRRASVARSSAENESSKR